MDCKEHDIFTVTCAPENWVVKASMKRLHGRTVFEVVFEDIAAGKSAALEQRKLRFPLEPSFLEDSFTVFSNDRLLLSFIRKNGRRHLLVNAPALVLPDGRTGLMLNLSFRGGKTLSPDDFTRVDSGMRATGYVRLGDDFSDLAADALRADYTWFRRS